MDGSQDPHQFHRPNSRFSGNSGSDGDRDRRLGELHQQLLQSPAYQTALNGLKEMFGDAGYAASMLMHQVSREAIALALHDPVPTTDLPSAPPISQPISQTRAQSPSLRHRYLYRLGQYLRAHRCRQHLSLVQLHHRTRIPISHLHALESGHISHYPQSSAYQRGSLHLWATALGLNADAILAKMPIAAPQPAPPQPPPTLPPIPPRPRAVTNPATSSDNLNHYPLWWRSLACGTPLLATVGLALWFANFSPSSQPPLHLPNPDSPNSQGQTPQPSSLAPVEGHPEIIPPEPLWQRRD